MIHLNNIFFHSVNTLLIFFFFEVTLLIFSGSNNIISSFKKITPFLFLLVIKKIIYLL